MVTSPETLLVAIIAVPFIGGGLAILFPANARNAEAYLAGLVTVVALAVVISTYSRVTNGGIVQYSAAWVPELGLEFSLRMDGFAWLMATLIPGIGLLVVLYARYYMSPADPVPRFFSLLLAFMGAMLGIVLSGNLIQLVFFWELTSLFSFLLIGYWHQTAQAQDGARMALTITASGGLCLFAGILILGHIVGSYDLNRVLASGAAIRSHSLYIPTLVLILLGALTKSAQFPFHFWLPHAMAAPTPVSAYLHSATMVKAGVFLLVRLWPALGGSNEWLWLVGSAGLITFVLGAFLAIFQQDLKGLLAYSTISHLGLITLLIGLDTPLGQVAAIFHIMNHATFKASLFMAAGIIDHETGTRDLRRLGGLYRLMPWTATFAMTAAAAMAGIPLFNGFLSKEMFFHEAVESTLPWGVAVPVIATLAGIFSMAYSVRLVHATFFNGVPKDLPPDAHPHDPPIGMLAPVALLAVLCVVVGVLPAITYGPLVHSAATALLGTAPPDYHLAIWHGFNLPLLMSAIAVAGGLALYFTLQKSFGLPGYTPQRWSGKASFTCLMDSLFAFSGRLTGRIENGSLQRSLALLVLLVLILAVAPFGAADRLPEAGSRTLLDAPPLAIVVWALLLAAGGTLVWTHHARFQAVVLTGVVGMVTALTFVALSAPDLALTQLSVEVVSTVLLLMGLALLPQTSPRESTSLRYGRDAALALAAGGGVAALAWLMLTRDHASISWFFLDNTLPGGGGTNAVNVILVDFRGYDTFGEITVLGIAALGALALLDGLRVKRPTVDTAGRAWSFEQQPLLLRVAARIVLPLALVVSAYIFWRGHNLPGGGFIAGLVTAVALVLQFMALGQARAESALHGASGRRFSRWIGSGLAIAGLTGVAAFVFGKPFLTSAHGHPTVAVLGELPLASAAVFDLGVYITVVGATLLMLSVLGAASKENHG